MLLNKSLASPFPVFGTTGATAVESSDDRVGLKMLIERYQELASRTADEALLRRIKEQVADLEQKLREFEE